MVSVFLQKQCKDTIKGIQNQRFSVFFVVGELLQPFLKVITTKKSTNRLVVCAFFCNFAAKLVKGQPDEDRI